MYKYSERESLLLHTLGRDDFLSQEPAVTYRTLALDCFSEGLTGPLAESIRRCYNAMQEGSPYRLTEEFDSLIEFPLHMTETTEQKLQRLSSYDEELSKVMHPDFKDWWQNNKVEWPLIARFTIERLREELLWYHDALDRLHQELMTCKYFPKDREIDIKLLGLLKKAIPGFSVTISDSSKRIDGEWHGRWTYTVKDCNGDRLFESDWDGFLTLGEAASCMTRDLRHYLGSLQHDAP